MKVAQTIHAAGASVREPVPPETRAVALCVRDQPELLALAERLGSAGIAFTLIREPDPPYLGAAMALGVSPQPRAALRRHLSSLPLLR